MVGKSFQESEYLKTVEDVGSDERIMCIVHQHPFGIIFIYILTFICLSFSHFGVSLLLPNSTAPGVNYATIAMLSILVVLVIGVLLTLATIVYRKSKLTVTDKNVVQIIQNGLLNKRVSQLSLANVEDVTSQQKGILANIFGYGILNIETAGEQTNFNFNYCPNPHRVAKIILHAKDDFMHATGQTGSARNRFRFPIGTQNND
jgi:hypothetical protein